MRTITTLALLLTACTAPNPAPQGVLDGTPEDTTAGLRAAMMDAIGRLAALEAASADLAAKVNELLAAGPGASQLALDNLGKDVAALGERIGKLEGKPGFAGTKQLHLMAPGGVDLGIYVDPCTGAVDLGGGKIALTQWCLPVQLAYEFKNCAGMPLVRMTDRAFTSGNLSARFVSQNGFFLTANGRSATATLKSVVFNNQCMDLPTPPQDTVIPVSIGAGGARTYSPDEMSVALR